MIVEVDVSNKIAQVRDRTIVGICGNSDYVILFNFDDEWNAYETKTARFKWNGEYTDVVFNGNECPMPIIYNTNTLEIGVYAGELHTTTAAVLYMKKSVLCGSGTPVDPEPDVYGQIIELINSMEGVDPEDIANAVEKYLTEHPIEEKDPTVPNWAKAGTKPTYTASEVGAMSQDDLQSATDAALAQAKASGEFDGADGDDGITPHIGSNGNWYIDDTDTGVKAQGTDGYSPVVTASKDGKTTTISVDGVAIATVTDGEDGEDGDVGATPNIQIGTVTTLDAGSDATANMTGTRDNPLLNLGIPKGADGSGGSGGETWELLANQDALTEDVVAVSFDVPDCRKYMVLVSLVNSEASAGGRAGQVSINESNATKLLTVGSNFINTSGTRSARFEAEKVDGRIQWTVASSLNGDGIVDGIVENMGSFQAGAFDQPADAITKLTVSSLNMSMNHFLGAGTRIKIYGVRA